MANLRIFAGRSLDGISALMPEVTNWIKDTLTHWCNLTTAGIVSATKMEFFLAFMSNKLAEHKRNSVGIFIHTNRAAQVGGASERIGLIKK